MEYKYWSDYTSLVELQKYGANSLMMYALKLRFDIDDIDSVASESITDGYEDKKCDLIYVDESERIAIIAQAYIKQNPQPNERAKLTKAQDLNTAASWVLGRDIDDVPNLLKSAVVALRNAIDTGKITSLYFWYVHNCDECNDIHNELDVVTTTAKAILNEFAPGINININGFEIGNQTLEKWYSNTTSKILVDKDIEIDLPYGGYEIKRAKWSAYQAYISGKQLHELYGSYGDDLFSANPRRFLGTGKRTSAINLGIKNSAENESPNFWAYNNGVTALVHSYEYDEVDKLRIKGISIINGAQTTGTIGTLASPPDDLYISMRVIKCIDQQTIESIIANNNRQNEMIPSDYRSNDTYQTRLRDEFSKYPHLYYSGGLRSNLRPRNREVFHPDTVAQTLLAFSGNPVDAYDSIKEIWSNDTLYSQVFNDELEAEHVIFVYSLSKAIDDIKLELQQKAKTVNFIDTEKKQLEFLSRRGSRILLLASLSNCLENVLARTITSPRKLHFDDNSDFAACKSWWKPSIKAILSLYHALVPALSAGGLDSKTKANDAMFTNRALLSAIIGPLTPEFEDLRLHTKVN